MALTITQIEAARSLGGGALLRKYDQLEARISSGKAGKGESAELEKIESRIIELAARGGAESPPETAEVVPANAEEPKADAAAVDRADKKIKALERVDKLKAFQKAGMMIPEMWSKKLGKMVAVISKPEQRAEITDPNISIYTIEETILIAKEELDQDEDEYKKLDLVKGVFDGEVAAVVHSQKAVA